MEDTKDRDAPGPQREGPANERRTFLKQAAACAVGMGSITATHGLALAAGQDGNSSRFAGPVRSQRVIRNEQTSNGARHESTVEIELVDSSNVKLNSIQFMSRTDLGPEYDVVVATTIRTFSAAEDSTPTSVRSQVHLIHGKKGDIQGDYRMDQVTLTEIRDGIVARQPPQTRRILVRNPFKNMSDQQIVDEMAQRKFGSQ